MLRYLYGFPLLLIYGCTLPGLVPPVNSAPPLQTEANDIVAKKMIIHQLELSLKAIDQTPAVVMLPSPVIITPPPSPPSVPPVVITPVPSTPPVTGIPGTFPQSPPVNPSFKRKSSFSFYVNPEEIAEDYSEKKFWKEHPPTFNIIPNNKDLVVTPNVAKYI